MIANVRILEAREHGLLATSNFVVYRSRRGRDEAFVGRAEHELTVGARVRIRRKTIFLVHETLAAQGKISILL